ncbi:MAG: alpha-glucuronidase [Bacteroidales bacterium]|nr:alpha-glucuronidase [Bacteroidales bacterium]
MKKLLLFFLTLTLLSSCGKETSVFTGDFSSEPLRLLNHWDNLNGTVERGYAGRSLFWRRGGIDTLSIQEYGRRNQEYGINGAVLNNVNASPQMLTDVYLDTTAMYADLLRPYGMKVYLSVNFATPLALGQTTTADPLDTAVVRWWKEKVDEIYRRIPDFGGFLVKASSEGQPGPGNYGRSHAEGANMIARALYPHKGVLIWRAFVYSPTDLDRAKQAYIEFADLDGQFDKNVIIQIKNGPVDFQPREPVSPLFFALKKTRVMAELQITQEYLGHSNHIAFLAPMWIEFLNELKLGGAPAVKDFAGVANVGTNGCGNKMAEANWYAFGRIANDPEVRADSIAKDWVEQNFPDANDRAKLNIRAILLMSREAVVNYMMPMGLHHQFAWGHHYGPEPWCALPGIRYDWMPSYYHRSDTIGLGFDRTVATGTAATAQYPDSMAQSYENLETCDERYLVWFHHAPWTYTRKWACTGVEENVWNHLGRHYQSGVNQVRQMQLMWNSCKGQMPDELWQDISNRLNTQLKDAVWWKDACLLYFQHLSKQDWPPTAEKPKYKLEDLRKIHLRISNFECPSAEMLDAVR